MDSDQRPFEDNSGPGQLLLIIKQNVYKDQVVRSFSKKSRGAQPIWSAPKAAIGQDGTWEQGWAPHPGPFLGAHTMLAPPASQQRELSQA